MLLIAEVIRLNFGVILLKCSFREKNGLKLTSLNFFWLIMHFMTFNVKSLLCFISEKNLKINSFV